MFLLGRKHKLEDLKEFYREKGCELLADEYINAVTSMPYICGCGNPAKTPFKHFKQGRRCRKCGSKKAWEERKFTLGEVKKMFSDEGCTLLATEYENNSTKMPYNCICGNESVTTLSNFQSGARCLDCGNKRSADKRRKSLSEVKELFLEGGCELLATEYLNNETKMPYVCRCGNPSEITLNKFLQGRRCMKCADEKRSEVFRKPIEEIRKMFSDEGCELLSTEYVNAHTPVDYICKCGSPHSIAPNSFRAGRRCPDCGLEKRRGENNHKYNPELTDEEREEKRDTAEIIHWRKKVFKRDDYTCQCCSSRNVILNAHHIRNYAEEKGLRLDLNNGVTLCSNCHTKFHKEFGYRNNTQEQLGEFIAKARKVTS